jgi:crossover junction endodeoxyribonuclease RuvC
MHTIFCGIDPGLEGALVVLDGDEVEFHDSPIVQDGKRRRIDAAKVGALLRDIKADSFPRRLMVTIEKSQPMPPIVKGKREPGEIGHGSIASFSLGYSFGGWVFALSALEIPYQLVAPQTWKAALMRDCPKEKDASRMVARRLFPVQTEEALSRKKDHNRADALLIAEWGRRNVEGKSGLLEE